VGVKGIPSFTDEFPNRPPSIIMTTESGRFAVNSVLCVSQLSDLHADEWSPSCTIAALLQTLFVFWLDDQSAHIGKVESTHERKRALAAASLEANLRFGPGARSHARACRRTRGLAIAGRGLSGIWGVGMHPTCHAPIAHASCRNPRFVELFWSGEALRVSAPMQLPARCLSCVPRYLPRAPASVISRRLE